MNDNNINEAIARRINKVVVLDKDGSVITECGGEKAWQLYTYYLAKVTEKERVQYPADDEEARELKESALQDTADYFFMEYRTVREIILVVCDKIMKMTKGEL